MRHAPWLVIPVLLLAVGAARAQVASGPPKGEKVPALKVYAVTGPQENKELDYAAERKDKPTVYVFVKSKDGGIPEGGRPAGRFMKELDRAVKKLSDDAYIVAVWLTENQDNTKAYLPRIQMSLQFESTGLTYFQGEKSGPKDWAVNEDAHVTVVVAGKGKVTETFGYMSLNETDVPPVEEALKKALK
jgi:hypothetical protein